MGPGKYHCSAMGTEAPLGILARVLPEGAEQGSSHTGITIHNSAL